MVIHSFFSSFIQSKFTEHPLACRHWAGQRTCFLEISTRTGSSQVPGFPGPILWSPLCQEFPRGFVWVTSRPTTLQSSSSLVLSPERHVSLSPMAAPLGAQFSAGLFSSEVGALSPAAQAKPREPPLPCPPSPTVGHKSGDCCLSERPRHPLPPAPTWTVGVASLKHSCPFPAGLTVVRRLFF